MSSETQRVVVIQDASRDVSPSAITWVSEGLSLKPGDKLTLLGVLHQVNNPSTLSFRRAGKLLGYKIKVDANSMFGTNNKIVAEEVARKKEEYESNPEVMKISKQCETQQIEFQIEVEAGPCSRMVALNAVKRLKATWVILDRYMKKDNKFFTERLYCGISRIKSNNSMEQLRGPKQRENTKLLIQSSGDHVTYDEMIPGTPTKSFSPQRTSSGGQHLWKSASLPKSSSSEQLVMSTGSGLVNTEASSSSLTEAKYSAWHFQDEQYTTNTELETAEEESPVCMSESQEKGLSMNDDWVGGNSNDQVFMNSICTICKNRRPKIGWKRDFSYAELQAATEGFSPKNFLSEGGFGSVFRGELNGLKIAVKQHKNASFQGEKEFKSEVEVLSKARHENLVMLLGSCSEGKQRLLIYEYVCNGSLDQHLSKHSRRPLSWEKRMKIALGAARGLQYLHENNIIHRDMRPNNILVTHDYEPLLGDFGLARTQQGDPDHSSETRVVGTLGYLAPEYAEFGKVSTKTDVYSFGVVLLQLITGLKTTDKLLGGKSLVGWARPLLKERNYPDLIDPRILDSHDVHQLFWMVRVAEKCLTKDPQKRLPIRKVVYALSYIMEGDMMCSIRELSPAETDSRSSSSIHDSDSQADDTTDNTMSHVTRELPPSPSMQVMFSRRPTVSTLHAAPPMLGFQDNLQY